MIKENGRTVLIEQYPDGTQRFNAECNESDIKITWKYNNDGELFSVIALAKSYKAKGCRVSLEMPYIPNARMDRVKSPQEVFTLKVFCELINNVGFEDVTVLDAHSNVSLALIDRVKEMNVCEIIKKAAIERLPKDIVIYFPDEGSQKRYRDYFKEYRCACGNKKRDWKTGKIECLEVIDKGIDLRNKKVLMIDDIISYGGSLYYSALKLKEMGVEEIFAYATHTENSVLDKNKGKLIRLLEDGTVSRLFTTDSIFAGEHEKIEVTEV